MCRLLAVMVPEKHQANIDRDIMPAALDALASTALRLLSDDGKTGNQDGTGVAQIANNVPLLIKTSQTADEFTTQKEYREFMSNINWKYPFLGHVRAASVSKAAKDAQGKLPNTHAQPFITDQCILMHNGTVNNWKEIAVANDIAEYASFTDSWLLTQLLDKDEWTYDLWRHVTSQLDGSFALIGTHIKNPKELWVTRIKRPLYVYELDNGIIHIICTSEILDRALMEVGETVFKLTGKDPWKNWNHHKIGDGILLKYNIEGAGSIEDLGPIEEIQVSQSWNNQSRHHNQYATEKHFCISDILLKLFEKYEIATMELRYIWEQQEGITKNQKWSTSEASKVVRFIKWCFSDEDRKKVLSEALGRPIVEKEA